MKETAFDIGKYGAIVRKKRAKLGYRNVEEFSAGIQRKTHAHISKDTLYRIEQGKQEPNATQFIAINLCLFNKAFPQGYNGNEIEPCLPAKWREYDREERMPQSWKYEVLDKAFSDCGFISDDGKKCIFESDIPDDIHDEIGFSDESFIPPLQITQTDKYGASIFDSYEKAGEYYIIAFT